MKNKGFANLERYFFAGLVIVVPVALTLYILGSIFSVVDNFLGKFLNAYFRNTLGFSIPGIGFFLFLLIILLCGFLAARLVKHRIFQNIERWFSGLPLIKHIYPAMRQVIVFMSVQKELGFKRVVLVEYPSKGIWSIGFLTNDKFPALDVLSGKEMVSVFIATTPSPFSGFVVFFAKNEVRFPEMAVSEALNIIISGGVFKGQEQR